MRPEEGAHEIHLLLHRYGHWGVHVAQGSSHSRSQGYLRTHRVALHAGLEMQLSLAVHVQVWPNAY